MRSSEPVGSTTDATAEAGPAVQRAPASAVVAAGPLSVTEAVRLQRAAGNRAVARMAAGRRVLARDVYSTDRKRHMKEGAEKALYKPDTEFTGPEGDLFVYDDFDRTLTVFTPESGPHRGAAYRLTYAEGTPDELSALGPEKLFVHTEALSPLRAKALRWLRNAAGTYQESEDKRKTRVADARARWAAEKEDWAKLSDANRKAYDKYKSDTAAYAEAVKEKKPLPPAPVRPPGLPIDAKPTNCNQHVGEFATGVLGTGMYGMDPRQQAIDLGRSGAFRTLMSHPFKVGEFDKGPRAGDIISYGTTGGTAKPGALRRADFVTIMHVGVLKSRRPGKEPGTELWTVVDGGQGGFENRQETRERNRVFTIEHMTANVSKQTKSGSFQGYETEGPGRLRTTQLDVGVFKQRPTDYILRGWLDIDAFAGGASTALPEGAGHHLFPQKRGEPAAAPS